MKKMENWLAKLVNEVGLVRKIYFTYHIEKFRIEQIMLPPVYNLGGHSQLWLKIDQLAAGEFS